MLDKTFRPADVEARQYRRWEEAGAFAQGRPGTGAPYTIVIPPPNVTGSLHMGHALNNTLQDVLVRWRRMQGRDALWQPGTDHAGIATQMVVERRLAAEGIEPDRGGPPPAANIRRIDRDEFVRRVWEWKEESGGTIVSQLRRLGASCDWSRERFTMDEGLSRAVLEVFVRLYKEGLIYKDQRLVNWDPKLNTAISDLEVQPREVDGHLWYLRYPVEDTEGEHIVVATTRPETMLGDTAVAVHKDDPRWGKYVGRHVVLPLVGRRIPVVADEHADPEQGSGAVKITPAHDFNDFEVGRRHNLPAINVLDLNGKISIVLNDIFWENTKYSARLGSSTEVVNSLGGFPSNDNSDYVPYAVDDPELDEVRNIDGLDRFKARDRILYLLERDGLVEKTEKHRHVVPYGDRSGVPLEPRLTDQWYVNAAKLAKPAIRAVEEGRTCFVPENWTKTYYEWMRNIQPWCISRQLWWGHQIPCWYGPEGTKFVERTEAEAILAAKTHFGREIEVVAAGDAKIAWLMESEFSDTGFGRFTGSVVPVYRDLDVLDTWFSSALWPFSTLGWPGDDPVLARHYPTDVLVTGFDIIFFWVARMMMMGLHFMDGRVPFHTVYIHALVRDEQGQKMSKSKGNVIDPLEIVDEYGADALRFTLVAMAAMGRDIKLSPARVAGYRNFGTKLWNATRFCEMNECRRDPAFDPHVCNETLNRWIVGEAARATAAIGEALEGFRFDQAAGAVYRFVWNTFCDWYLELAKPVLQGEDSAARAETRATTAWVLDRVLHALHPFMPYLTEELWEQVGGGSLLATAPWPADDSGLVDADAVAEMDWVVRLVSGIRTVRAEMNVPPGAAIPAILRGASAATTARLSANRDQILRLARLADVSLDAEIPKGSAQIVVDEATLALPLADVIDLDKERQRLQREIAKLASDIDKIDRKLADDKFVSRAPEEVVEEQRERRAEAADARSRLETALARLAAA